VCVCVCVYIYIYIYKMTLTIKLLADHPSGAKGTDSCTISEN